MKQFETISALQEALERERQKGRTIGFVPTMGALHDGHISLVKHCKSLYEVVVVSVFVNPTQFNDAKDLETYPRNLSADATLLEKNGCDYLFAPSVAEIYPEPDTREFDFGFIGQTMEGSHRPGHFNGVAQVVSKLFEIVRPHGACFGEKDFQQIAIIQSMVRQLSLPVEIVRCPIFREPSGLALSSRNQRLSQEALLFAPRIAQILQESRSLKSTHSPQEVQAWVLEQLTNTEHLKPEYYEIVEAETLQPITSWTEAQDAVGCVTCYCDDVRLIDNIHY